MMIQATTSNSRHHTLSPKKERKELFEGYYLTWWWWRRWQLEKKYCRRIRKRTEKNDLMRMASSVLNFFLLLLIPLLSLLYLFMYFLFFRHVPITSFTLNDFAPSALFHRKTGKHGLVRQQQPAV